MGMLSVQKRKRHEISFTSALNLNCKMPDGERFFRARSSIELIERQRKSSSLFVDLRGF